MVPQIREVRPLKPKPFTLYPLPFTLYPNPRNRGPPNQGSSAAGQAQQWLHQGPKKARGRDDEGRSSGAKPGGFVSAYHHYPADGQGSRYSGPMPVKSVCVTACCGTEWKQRGARGVRSTVVVLFMLWLILFVSHADMEVAEKRIN